MKPMIKEILRNYKKNPNRDLEKLLDYADDLVRAEKYLKKTDPSQLADNA